MIVLFRSLALLLAATAAMALQRGLPKVPGTAAGRAAARHTVGGGSPKAAPGRLANPANPVARLYRASPDERERALEKLPAAQQERFRKNLQWFDSLPKPQRQSVLQQVDRFSALPPERQKAVGENLRALNQLPPERRGAVRGALRRLQSMDGPERDALLESDRFKSRFSSDEQKIIHELSESMMPPQ